MSAVFARAAAKSFLSFVAVPVNCFWNMFMMALVMREIMVCSIGTAFIYDINRKLFRGYESDEGINSGPEHATPRLREFSYDARAQAIRAVGVAIVYKKALHPNLEIYLRLLRGQLMDRRW
jgi:hypothetical protein